MVKWFRPAGRAKTVYNNNIDNACRIAGDVYGLSRLAVDKVMRDCSLILTCLLGSRETANCRCLC